MSLTLKQVAKKIKAKGLLKLKHFCQLCQKQCRDDAGFRAHCTSEGHLRQMALFDQNKKTFMNDYSQQFKQGFIDTLRTGYQTARVSANKVYQDFIRDRSHIHMNSTNWSSLTEFVLMLGKEGICEVEETEKGWYLKYIKRDSKEQERMEKQLKNEGVDKSEDEQHLAQLHKQIEEAKKMEEKLEALKKESAEKQGDSAESSASKLARAPVDKSQISISFGKNLATKGKEKKGFGISLQKAPVKATINQEMKESSDSLASHDAKPVASIFDVEEVDQKKEEEEKKATQKRKLSSLEGILEESQRHKKKQRTGE